MYIDDAKVVAKQPKDVMFSSIYINSYIDIMCIHMHACKHNVLCS